MKSNTLGKQLKLSRISQDLSQRDVAKRIGIPSYRLCRIESGKLQPTSEEYTKLIAILKPMKSEMGDLELFILHLAMMEDDQIKLELKLKAEELSIKYEKEQLNASYEQVKQPQPIPMKSVE
jgi:transcriptional regulator with XRE-family HTH domain